MKLILFAFLFIIIKCVSSAPILTPNNFPNADFEYNQRQNGTENIRISLNDVFVQVPFDKKPFNFLNLFQQFIRPPSTPVRPPVRATPKRDYTQIYSKSNYDNENNNNVFPYKFELNGVTPHENSFVSASSLKDASNAVTTKYTTSTTTSTPANLVSSSNSSSDRLDPVELEMKSKKMNNRKNKHRFFGFFKSIMSPKMF